MSVVVCVSVLVWTRKSVSRTKSLNLLAFFHLLMPCCRHFLSIRYRKKQKARKFVIKFMRIGWMSCQEKIWGNWMLRVYGRKLWTPVAYLLPSMIWWFSWFITQDNAAGWVSGWSGLKGNSFQKVTWLDHQHHHVCIR